MGSSWSGFVPQNDIIKLQWAILEGCQTEVATKALSVLLGTADQSKGEPEDEENNSWTSASADLVESKDK